MSPSFVALDFETADSGADSACAIGLVKARGGRIVEEAHFLIRPPRSLFTFSYIHGIRWEHVKDKPTFADLWPQIEAFITGVDFLAAHNAPFDRKVLEACCKLAGVSSGERHFLCTVQLARRAWNVRPTRLPNVCDYLGLELAHHEALSDARACANIVLSALRQGHEVWQPQPVTEAL
jgi:DNA polymerase III subunit epsilon